MPAASDAAVTTKPALTLKRRLNAPPAKVFEAWTDPEKIIRWFGPAAAVSGSIRAEMDVRVGGRFRASFKTDDGEYHEVSGVYVDVVPDQRLSFTWTWYTTPERESLVTITLAQENGGTLLTLHHEQFFDDAARNGHRSGWTATLDKLEKMFA